MPLEIATIRETTQELARKIGQWSGRAEWLGRDFGAMLLTRLEQIATLAAVDPNASAVAEIEELRGDLEERLSGYVHLVEKASEIFDSIIEDAKSVLGALPKAN